MKSLKQHLNESVIDSKYGSGIFIYPKTNSDEKKISKIFFGIFLENWEWDKKNNAFFIQIEKKGKIEKRHLNTMLREIEYDLDGKGIDYEIGYLLNGYKIDV